MPEPSCCPSPIGGDSRRFDLTDSAACTALGFFVNLLLMAFKLAAGVFGHSYAMIADGIHSASDGVATGTAYFGIKVARKPADPEHPYGHGAAEAIVAFFIGLLLFGTGAYLGGTAVHLIAHGHESTPGNIALGAAIASIVIKEVLFQYTMRIGKRHKSPAVIASAWDHRSDALSSIGSLAGIIGARLGVPVLDPVAGMIIAGFIIWVSVRLLRSNIGLLMDESPPPAFLGMVRDLACRVEGVRGVDDVRVHRCGAACTLDIKIAVDGHLTVEEGHRIAGKLRFELSRQIAEVRDVMVHVNPFPSGESSSEWVCGRRDSGAS